MKIIRSSLDATLKELYSKKSEKGHLQIIVDDCYSLAIPFIMFRLKREGYSDVKAYCCARRIVVSFIR